MLNIKSYTDYICKKIELYFIVSHENKNSIEITKVEYIEGDNL